jgi:hypothetical protein
MACRIKAANLHTIQSHKPMGVCGFSEVNPMMPGSLIGFKIKTAFN